MRGAFLSRRTGTDRDFHKRLARLNQKHFDYISRHGIGEEYMEFMERFRAEQGGLNLQRSKGMLEGALARCEELHRAGRIRKRTVAIVMGSRHIPEILQEA